MFPYPAQKAIIKAKKVNNESLGLPVELKYCSLSSKDSRTLHQLPKLLLRKWNSRLQCWIHKNFFRGSRYRPPFFRVKTGEDLRHCSIAQVKSALIQGIEECKSKPIKIKT